MKVGYHYSEVRETFWWLPNLSRHCTHDLFIRKFSLGKENWKITLGIKWHTQKYQNPPLILGSPKQFQKESE